MDDRLKLFRQALQESPEHQNEILQGGDIAEVAAKLGFELSEEELNLAFMSLDQEEELSDFELELVAGGKELC